MSFAAPWLLLALAALPVLFWLLRLTPPLPQTLAFPPIALLARLRQSEETPAHLPLWLLLLRLAIAALVIIGLAGPNLGPRGLLAGDRPVLLVLDDGWSAAADWPARQRAAAAVLDQAARRHLRVALLTLARDPRDTAPAPTAFLPAAALRARLAALRPLPWPDDGAAAAASLQGWKPGAAQPVLIGATLAQPGAAALDAALRRIGRPTWIAHLPPATLLLRPPLARGGQMLLRAERVASDAPQQIAVLAQDAQGSLARTVLRFAAGADHASAPLVLPARLRNRLQRLVVAGPPAAASTILLDARNQRHTVGLLAGAASAPETPLLGALFYLRAALAPIADLPLGDVRQLIAAHVAMIVLADGGVADPATRRALAAWVAQGGVLLRFAGPALAALAGTEGGVLPDPLLPVRLLPGTRQLGGAMSWTHPESLAPFPAGSPFAGLAVPADVRVRRQVLAAPGPDLAATSWASLGDGTPLISGARRGNGWVVLVHVTANADWSSLPLSGLFPRLLRRLLDLADGGVAPAGTAPLAARAMLDGFGRLLPPGPAAALLPAASLERTPPGPRAPPGLYGPAGGVRARNLGAVLPKLLAAPPIPGARLIKLDGIPPARDLGPWLIAAACLLFAADLLAGLALRGLLRLAWLALLAISLSGLPAPARAASPEDAALTTRLAWLRTGDAAADAASAAGLAALSAYVTGHTAATLGSPAEVVAGVDDLSVYPLLYWGIGAAAPPPDGRAIAALDSFMSHGGILLIDTARHADLLAGLARGLVVPPLAPLTATHVLAHSFYLLHRFPGTLANPTVWVAGGAGRDADGVSPIIIGNGGWADAWARAARPAHILPDPDAARQGVLALRFGVNLVIYALTGTYKGDQVHVPTILRRLGTER